MSCFRRLWRGLNWSEQYGHHPGWIILGVMYAFGALERGWIGVIFITIFCVPPFLIGAWHRGD